MPLSLNDQFRNNNPGLKDQAALNTDVYNLLVEMKTKFNLLLEKLHADERIAPGDLAMLTVSAVSPSDPDA